jgi:hypothetical protein
MVWRRFFWEKRLGIKIRLLAFEVETLAEYQYQPTGNLYGM